MVGILTAENLCEVFNPLKVCLRSSFCGRTSEGRPMTIFQLIVWVNKVYPMWKNCGRSSVYKRNVKGILFIADMWKAFQVQKTCDRKHCVRSSAYRRPAEGISNFNPLKGCIRSPLCERTVYGL